MLVRLRQNIQNNPRRALLLLMLIATALLIFIWVVRFVNQGTLVVTTNSPSSNIEVRRSGEPEIVASSVGEMKMRFAAGDYVVTARTRYASTQRFVEIIPRDSVEIDFKLSEPADPEYVLPVGARDVVAGASTMYYLGTSDGLLYKLDSSGIPVVVSHDVAFSSIKWQDENFGVGLDENDTSLYTVRSGIIKPLSIPTKRSARLQYDLASNGRLVVADGDVVYVSASGGAFKQLYRARGEKVVGLSASDTNTYIRTAELSVEEGEDSTAAKSILINSSGETIASSESIDADRFSLSPDGKNLVSTTSGITEIYNSSLERKSGLPDGALTVMVWLDDKNLLYSANAQLFSYNLTTGSSSVLVNAPTGKGIEGIYPSVDRSAIFILVKDNSGDADSALLRVSAPGSDRVSESYSRKLGVFFPSYNDQCSFSYTNFLRPVLLITAWSDQITCADAAKEELKADELPLDKFNVVFKPSVDL